MISWVQSLFIKVVLAKFYFATGPLFWPIMGGQAIVNYFTSQPAFKFWSRTDFVA